MSRISLFALSYVISCSVFLSFSLVLLFIKHFVICPFLSGATLLLFQLSKILENNPKYQV